MSLNTTYTIYIRSFTSHRNNSNNVPIHVLCGGIPIKFTRQRGSRQYRLSVLFAPAE